jgi:hypothetical protein
MPLLGFSIAHKKSRPERRKALASMLEVIDREGPYRVHVEDRPGTACDWSLRQWREGLDLDTQWCVMLNDDLRLPAGFTGTLAKIAEALAASAPVVALSQHMEEAKRADAEGRRYVTSRGLLVGQAYMMPAHVLAAFLAWRQECFDPITAIPKHPLYCSEDALINAWCIATDRYVWHTVPALYEHIDGPSIFGNDNDWGRTPTVPLREPLPDNWKVMPPIMTRAYMTPARRALLCSLRPEARLKYRTVEKAYSLDL